MPVQQVLDVAQREGKSDVHHHGEADDFRLRLEVAERIGHARDTIAPATAQAGFF